jgi:hypothetical protein
MSKETSKSDILVGVVAIIALAGIGYFLIVNGFDNVPNSKPIEHRTDTIRTLPIIEFNSDTISSDSIKK